MVRSSPITDGTNLLFMLPAAPNATHSAREMFVRYAADRVAEIRVRYQVGPRAADKAHPSLYDKLRAGAAGAPEELPAPWSKLWTDLPAQKPAPFLLQWVDDLTVMTYQRDAGGIEVILRDCDLEHPYGVPLPPLRFVSRGVEHCVLGDRRGDVLTRYSITNPVTTNDGAIVLGQPAASPYDAVLVWFEDDKVSRIVARHRLKNKEPLKPDQIHSAMQHIWGSDIDRLGALRRQGGVWGQVLASYGWNDDQVRVMLFAQDTEEGNRLFSEWRTWPVPAKSIAAKPN